MEEGSEEGEREVTGRRQREREEGGGGGDGW